MANPRWPGADNPCRALVKYVPPVLRLPPADETRVFYATPKPGVFSTSLPPRYMFADLVPDLVTSIRATQIDKWGITYFVDLESGNTGPLGDVDLHHHPRCRELVLQYWLNTRSPPTAAQIAALAKLPLYKDEEHHVVLSYLCAAYNRVYLSS
ncbi:hypothetical protein EXIGLDRAFT_779709 [Exidia glandulosa HHB12029]|uniref:Uncharacterized protein n=1 Tax=Exidia glandulosa HHB12029 TaxID=1314781 RepID=A0A165BXG6_EXIGL|nr:hypothetical protein EXIGLDRAFT_779709 [Exidia glandulosa HHB12029]